MMSAAALTHTADVDSLRASFTAAAANANAAAAELIHHEGWLEKKSPSQVKGWQKRWVVLHGSMLRYWRDVADYHAEKSPSGVIHAHT